MRQLTVFGPVCEELLGGLPVHVTAASVDWERDEWARDITYMLGLEKTEETVFKLY